MPSHTLRFFETVDHPYDRVIEQLRGDALGVFRRASKSEAEAITDDGVQLHARLGAVEVAADVEIKVGEPAQGLSSPVGYPVTTFPLTWRARRNQGMFPDMHAQLRVYPHSTTRTQLELEGVYDPPLGLVGDALDALGGHRIAEASVGRFLQEVAIQLRVELQEADTKRGHAG